MENKFKYRKAVFNEYTNRAVYIVKYNDFFITDAPTDNNGKSKAFSLTDTVATALTNCMLTVMRIKANNLDVDMSGIIVEVIKTMCSNLRRICKIKIVISFPFKTSKKQNYIRAYSQYVSSKLQLASRYLKRCQL